MNVIKVPMQLKLALYAVLCGVLMVWCFSDWHTARNVLGSIFAIACAVSLIGFLCSFEN